MTHMGQKPEIVSASGGGFPELPFEVVVMPNRKRGSITSWGSAPLHISNLGYIVPDAFCFQSLLLGEVITMKTRVEKDGESVEYQFILNRIGAQGAFCRTQTSALDSLAQTLQEANYQPFASKYRKGTNGRLHAGVTYPAVQEAIHKAFGIPPLLAGGKRKRTLTEAVMPPVSAPTPSFTTSPLPQQQLPPPQQYPFPQPMPSLQVNSLQQQQQALYAQQQLIMTNGALILKRLRQNNYDPVVEAGAPARLS